MIAPAETLPLSSLEENEIFPLVQTSQHGLAGEEAALGQVRYGPGTLPARNQRGSLILPSTSSKTR